MHRVHGNGDGSKWATQRSLNKTIPVAPFTNMFNFNPSMDE